MHSNQDVDVVVHRPASLVVRHALEVVSPRNAIHDDGAGVVAPAVNPSYWDVISLKYRLKGHFVLERKGRGRIDTVTAHAEFLHLVVLLEAPPPDRSPSGLPLNATYLASEVTFDPCRDCGVRVLNAIHQILELVHGCGQALPCDGPASRHPCHSLERLRADVDESLVEGSGAPYQKLLTLSPAMEVLHQRNIAIRGCGLYELFQRALRLGG